ncbi:Pimeloyl-ACP methyl ester carboxylesterase [Actinopolyspora mzabensis]|uniref:Pimeloyl-ACP methyl ester carboxylesterase n=1 Tax=Actinopolyspora mzabensis TaxID=995066 RepID=A0A1G9C032_ACTMZ|nr:alpha/beta hydrolase [Actinopolyspora mzabensis]SDK44973.1 Pimeloyl-ACP methyl ester carboxylesterase [Actinopolyspora mzabensis]
MSAVDHEQLPVTSLRGRRSRERLDVSGSTLHYWRYVPAVPEPPEIGSPEADGPSGGSPGRSRPPMLLLHGLRGTHHGLEPLAAALPERELLIPDLPGFGDSGPMSTRRHDAAGYARAVVELLRKLDHRGERVDLLGHSFGSVVAAAVAAGSPELVRGLVLLNPISTPASQGPAALLARLTSLYYRLGELLPVRLGRALLSNRWIVLGASHAMLRTRDPRVRRFAHESHLRHFSRFHSPALLAETYRSSVSETVADHATELTTRTLLIAGETDEIAPLAGQRRMRDSLVDAELEVIEEVGHLVHYEAPRHAARSIRRFLDAV